MKRAIVVALLVLAACKSKPDQAATPGSAATQPPPPPPPPPIDRAALLEGKLPEGAPETDLVNAQCRVCHAIEYLTQQRLTEATWQKTIAKMRKFGAAVDDQQAASLAKFAATYWNPDLPPRTSWKLGPPPPGALPLTAAPTKPSQ